MQIIPYAQLQDADLIVDAIYEGEVGGLLSGEVLSRLLPGVGNQGGFRAAGLGDDKRFVALFAIGEDSDWPDELDLHTGQFVYYGDNKRPGRSLHDTQRSGNRLLRQVFSHLHQDRPQRHRIPPFFVFQKHATPTSARSLQYRGLAVPGFAGLPATSDLVAVWKNSEGQRFQNYRAVFTILDIPQVARAWINDLRNGLPSMCNAPEVWQNWVGSGNYAPLRSESTTVIRSREMQLPDTPTKGAILHTVWKHFRSVPDAFEAFAANLFKMHDQRVIIDEITPKTSDGGRDAIGRYFLGINDDPIYVDFSLEAKCYRPASDKHPTNSVGVREVARLISRIRHRQFGILVTTSVVGRQAYEEVRNDRHPIIFICGKDRADILSAAGYNSPELVSEMLSTEFAHD